MRREEDAAAAANRDLVARTEYGHLVQFLGNSESGTSVLQAFRIQLGTFSETEAVNILVPT